MRGCRYLHEHENSDQLIENEITQMKNNRTASDKKEEKEEEKNIVKKT